MWLWVLIPPAGPALQHSAHFLCLVFIESPLVAEIKCDFILSCPDTDSFLVSPSFSTPSVLKYLPAGGPPVIVFPRCLNRKMLKDVTDSFWGIKAVIDTQRQMRTLIDVTGGLLQVLGVRCSGQMPHQPLHLFNQSVTHPPPLSLIPLSYRLTSLEDSSRLSGDETPWRRCSDNNEGIKNEQEKDAKIRNYKKMKPQTVTPLSSSTCSFPSRLSPLCHPSLCTFVLTSSHRFVLTGKVICSLISFGFVTQRRQKASDCPSSSGALELSQNFRLPSDAHVKLLFLVLAAQWGLSWGLRSIALHLVCCRSGSSRYRKLRIQFPLLVLLQHETLNFDLLFWFSTVFVIRLIMCVFSNRQWSN